MRRFGAGLLMLVLLAAAFGIPGQVSAEPSGDATLDVVLVLDNSRSMRKNDPKFLSRELVKNFIQSLPEGSACGMVVFGKLARQTVPLILLSGAGAVDALFSGITAVDYSDDFTDSPAGIERALYELVKKGRPESRKIIVFLTDGIVDTGDRQEDARKREWLLTDITAQCKKNGVRIFGAAFTEEADYQLIQSLAERTSGGYYRAILPEEIRGVFNEVLEAALAPDETEKAPETATAVPQPAPAVRPPASPATPPAEEKAGSGLVLLGGLLLAACLSAVLFFMHRKRTHKSVILRRDAIFLGSPDLSRKPVQPKAEMLPLSGTPDFLPIIIRDPITRIGRKKGNEVVIDNPAISRFHAVIEFKDGAYYIEDQNSANKTIINDKPISPHTRVRLESGMTVAFDTVKYRFVRPDERIDDESIQDDDPADKTLFHNLNNMAAPKPSPAPKPPPVNGPAISAPSPVKEQEEQASALSGTIETRSFPSPKEEGPVSPAQKTGDEAPGSRDTPPSFSPAKAVEAALSSPAPPRAGANICPWHPDRFADVICPKCKKPCCDKCMAAKDNQFLCPACRLGG
ncbi:MAG: FHA domain-containing protein [Deltaproteobacteria bacterium]|nr:FHA domain-containing protein [Deltaproteobacteria bacterium]